MFQNFCNLGMFNRVGSSSHLPWRSGHVRFCIVSCALFQCDKLQGSLLRLHGRLHGHLFALLRSRRCAQFVFGCLSEQHLPTGSYCHVRLWLHWRVSITFFNVFSMAKNGQSVEFWKCCHHSLVTCLSPISNLCPRSRRIAR